MCKSLQETKSDLTDMRKRHNELDHASEIVRKHSGYAKITFTIDNDKLQFVNIDLKKKV